MKKWRPPRLYMKKTKWRTGQVSRPPSPALLLISCDFSGKEVGNSDNNRGKGTKIIFLSEVISPILSPKNRKN